MTWTNALTPESLVNLHVFWLYKILTDSNSQVFLLFSSFLESWDGDEDKEEKQGEGELSRTERYERVTEREKEKDMGKVIA